MMETVRKFCELATQELGWGKQSNRNGIIWKGSGKEEVGIREDNGKVIKVDPRYYRPTEVDELLGDSSKAFKELGWKPKISLESLVSEMIREDKKLAQKEKNNLRL